MSTDADDLAREEETEKYRALADEEVVALAQRDERQALLYLLTRYKSVVRIKARSYFLVGADHEDIVQEGMIGLYKAIRDYRPERHASFRAFADLCIKRQIISAIKNATRLKHSPLNRYVSLDKPLYEEDSDKTLMDMIGEKAANPEELFINQEKMADFQTTLDGMLSAFEQQVLICFLDGKSYLEIADALGRHVKGVDNALQRIKRKMAKHLKESAEREARENA